MLELVCYGSITISRMRVRNKISREESTNKRSSLYLNAETLDAQICANARVESKVGGGRRLKMLKQAYESQSLLGEY